MIDNENEVAEILSFCGFLKFTRVRIPDASLKRKASCESMVLFLFASPLWIRTSTDNVVGRGARRPGDVCLAPTEAERRANP